MSPAIRPAAVASAVTLLAACAGTPDSRPPGRIEIQSVALGQPVTGASCSVETAAGRWAVQTPGIVNVGEPSGDLRVVGERACDRRSGVLIRGSAAAGPGASRVGLGIGSGVGYGSGVGFSLGFGFPLGGSRPRYPERLVVEMTPLNSPQ